MSINFLLSTYILASDLKDTHITPFQNGEKPVFEQQQKLGLSFLFVVNPNLQTPLFGP
jgi:hypothetical protein